MLRNGLYNFIMRGIIIFECSGLFFRSATGYRNLEDVPVASLT